MSCLCFHYCSTSTTDNKVYSTLLPGACSDLVISMFCPSIMLISVALCSKVCITGSKSFSFEGVCLSALAQPQCFALLRGQHMTHLLFFGMDVRFILSDHSAWLFLDHTLILHVSHFHFGRKKSAIKHQHTCAMQQRFGTFLSRFQDNLLQS